MSLKKGLTHKGEGTEMHEKLSELDRLGRRLETIFEELEDLAMSEHGGDDAAELWLRARFRCAVAFDEHLRLLSEVTKELSVQDTTAASSAAEELRKLAARRPASERWSTFAKVLAGEDVTALIAIHSALKKESAATNTTKGTGE